MLAVARRPTDPLRPRGSLPPVRPCSRMFSQCRRWASLLTCVYRRPTAHYLLYLVPDHLQIMIIHSAALIPTKRNHWLRNSLKRAQNMVRSGPHTQVRRCMVIIMELCDQGSLDEAIHRGAFRLLIPGEWSIVFCILYIVCSTRAAVLRRVCCSSIQWLNTVLHTSVLGKLQPGSSMHTVCQAAPKARGT